MKSWNTLDALPAARPANVSNRAVTDGAIAGSPLKDFCTDKFQRSSAGGKGGGEHKMEKQKLFGHHHRPATGLSVEGDSRQGRLTVSRGSTSSRGIRLPCGEVYRGTILYNQWGRSHWQC